MIIRIISARHHGAGFGQRDIEMSVRRLQRPSGECPHCGATNCGPRVWLYPLPIWEEDRALMELRELLQDQLLMLASLGACPNLFERELP
jgi:hypothetical protein